MRDLAELKCGVAAVVLLGSLLTGSAGCESKSGTGTAIGAGAGAGVGAIVGSQVAGRGQRTEGALVGAGVGALVGGGTGYLVGREGDKKDEARRRERDREDRYYTAPAPAQPAPAYQPPPAAPAAPAVPPPKAGQGVTRQDVILWAQRGVREDIMIDRIERSGSKFNLTPADETQLRNSGVSEAVIRAMKATANR